MIRLFKEFQVKGRAVSESDRRKLGCIPDEEQFALFTAENILKKVVQQVPGRKKTEIREGGILDHGSLIDDKKRLLVKVLLELEGDHAILRGPGKVDFAVNSIRLHPGIAGKDFGGPAGRCQQYGAFLNFGKRLNEGTDDGGFTRSSITFQDEE
jgi:hypothetical protein